MGINNELPGTWEVFKNLLIDFCIGSGIDVLRKYKEEKWSSYVLRLKEWSEFRQLDEDIVFKKLRK